MHLMKLSLKYHITITILIVAFMLSFASIAEADSLLFGTQKSETLTLVVGKSIVLKTPSLIKRMSDYDSNIVGIIALNPTEILIKGKAAGMTNLILWDAKNNVSSIYNLEVTYDIPGLKQKLHELLPAEKDLRLITTNDSIALVGKISSAANLSQALALAQSYAPKGKVQNLLKVGGVHQVMLEVRIAEISKSLTKRLGFNFNWFKGDEFILSLLGGLTQLGNQENQTVSIEVSSNVNSIFRFNQNNATWTGFIDALRGNGLLKILAEPTLIALSGQSASFLVGGEFPVPVPDNDGITISYKEFGVGLVFTPTVLDDNRINMRVDPQVSELDFSIAVQTGGVTVPGLSTRKASTTIELADGQSFVIAGLLKDNVRENISKFPGLGEIPVLGALFRSSDFEKDESELMIIVTPHLVKPFDPAKQTLPTDFYVEPDDMEFYLLGLMEGRESPSPLRLRGEFDGDFGHAMPNMVGPN